MATKKTAAIKENEVQFNPDPLIDQDFKGFPHAPADRKTITAKTSTEKVAAGVKKKTNKKTYGG